MNGFFDDLLGISPTPNQMQLDVESAFNAALSQVQGLLPAFINSGSIAQNALTLGTNLGSDAKAGAVVAEAHASASEYESISQLWGNMQGEISALQDNMASSPFWQADTTSASKNSAETNQHIDDEMSQANDLTGRLEALADRIKAQIKAANTALSDAQGVSNFAQGKGFSFGLSSFGSSLTTIGKDMGIVLAAGAVIYLIMILPKGRKS